MQEQRKQLETLFQNWRDPDPIPTDTAFSHSRRYGAHDSPLEPGSHGLDPRKPHEAPPYHRPQNQYHQDQDGTRHHYDGAPSRKRQRRETPAASQDDRSSVFVGHGQQHKGVKDLFPGIARDSDRASTSSRTSTKGKNPPNYDYYDPYLETQSRMGRIKQYIEKKRRAALSKIPTRQGNQSEGAKGLRKVCNICMSRRIEREEISEDYLSKTSQSNLEILAKNWQAIGAVIFGIMFDRKFNTDEWGGNATSWQDIARPGMVIEAPIVEQQCDDNLAVDDLNRMLGRFARAVAKPRPCLVLRVEGEEAQVLYGTSFGDSDQPPSSKREECFRLMNSNEELPKHKGDRLPAIQFKGDAPLRKTTFMRHTRKHWVNLAQMPTKRVGELEDQAFGRVADIMGLQEKHPFRAKAAKVAAHMSGSNSDEDPEALQDQSGESSLLDRTEASSIEEGEVRE